MVASTYDEALKRVLVHEGGYTNHPSDPGGPTNWGITIADYREFKGRAVTAAEVRAMPLADAKAIYRAKYWGKLRCDLLPAGLDYAMFDYGVNSGIGRAGKVLRRILGMADATWIVGDDVVAAVNRRVASDLVRRLCDERLAFLKRLKTWPVFGAGWGRRVAEVKAAGLRMADAAKVPTTTRAPDPIPGATPGKGEVPLNKAGQSGTAGGIVATGATAAGQAHQAGIRPALIVAIVALTLVLAAFGWVYWRHRQQQQQEAPIPSA